MYDECGSLVDERASPEEKLHQGESSHTCGGCMSTRTRCECVLPTPSHYEWSFKENSQMTIQDLILLLFALGATCLTVILIHYYGIGRFPK